MSVPITPQSRRLTLILAIVFALLAASVFLIPEVRAENLDSYDRPQECEYQLKVSHAGSNELNNYDMVLFQGQDAAKVTFHYDEASAYICFPSQKGQRIEVSLWLRKKLSSGWYHTSLDLPISWEGEFELREIPFEVYPDEGVEYLDPKLTLEWVD